MALLDRIKERIEADVSDSELQLLIDGVQAEIEGRYGAASQQKVFSGSGIGRMIKLPRPADINETIIVSETTPRGTSNGAAEQILEADDFRVLHEGRILERLVGGTNSRQYWGELVTVVYTPVSAAAKYDEVIIKIVTLDLEYRGITSERAGDYNVSYGDMLTNREQLLSSLGDTSGLGMA